MVSSAQRHAYIIPLANSTSKCDLAIQVQNPPCSFQARAKQNVQVGGDFVSAKQANIEVLGIPRETYRSIKTIGLPIKKVLSGKRNCLQLRKIHLDLSSKLETLFLCLVLLGTIFILRKGVLGLFRTTHPPSKDIFIT